MTNIALMGLIALVVSGGAPVERGALPVNGAKLAYEVAGHGPAIVLIHAGVADMSMWDEPFRELSKHYRVLRYDLRGFGASKTQSVKFSNRQDLLALMDHAKIGKAVVVGNSMGGIIALDFALEHPSRVAGLISLSGSISGYDVPSPAAEKAVFERDEALTAKKDFEAASRLEANIWVNGPLQKEGRAPQAIWDRIHKLILHNFKSHTSEPKPIGLKPPALGRLHELKIPVLAMAGELDESSTQSAMALLAAKAPHARLIKYPNTAHLISLERPKEFLREVIEFAEGIAKKK